MLPSSRVMTGYRTNLKLCRKSDVLGWPCHVKFTFGILGFTVFVRKDSMTGNT